MTYLAQSLILFSNPSTNLPAPPPTALGDLVTINFGNNQVATSSNGTTWAVTSGFGLPSGQWANIKFSKGQQKFLATGLTTSEMYVSANGIVWETRGSSLSSYATAGPGKIIEGNNLILVLGQGPSPSTGYATTTANANIFWIGRNLPKSVRCTGDFGDGKFVLMTANGTSVTNKNIGFYSSDGINWTEFNTPVSGPGWVAVKYGEPAPGLSGGKQWVAIAGNTTSTSAVAAYSNDGFTWTESTLPTVSRYLGLAYSPVHNRWVAMEENGIFAISDNGGQTWAANTTGEYSGGQYAAIEYTDVGFIATTQFTNGAVAISNNGLDWTRYFPSTLNFGTFSRYFAIGAPQASLGNIVNAVTNTVINTTNLTVVSTPVKFNTLSIELPSSGTYPDDRPIAAIPFTKPSGTYVTVEFWRYFLSTAFNQAAIEFYNSADATFATIEPNFGVRQTSSLLGSSFSTPATNTWHHYVLVFGSSGFNRALNGTASTTTTTFTGGTTVFNNSDTLRFYNKVYSGRGTGFVEDVRISNGDIYNIYSGGSYTVPTSALTATANTTLLVKQIQKT